MRGSCSSISVLAWVALWVSYRVWLWLALYGRYNLCRLLRNRNDDNPLFETITHGGGACSSELYDSSNSSTYTKSIAKNILVIFLELFQGVCNMIRVISGLLWFTAYFNQILQISDQLKLTWFGISMESCPVTPHLSAIKSTSIERMHHNQHGEGYREPLARRESCQATQIMERLFVGHMGITKGSAVAFIQIRRIRVNLCFGK